MQTVDLPEKHHPYGDIRALTARDPAYVGRINSGHPRNSVVKSAVLGNEGGDGAVAVCSLTNRAHGGILTVMGNDIVRQSTPIPDSGADKSHKDIGAEAEEEGAGGSVLGYMSPAI